MTAGDTAAVIVACASVAALVILLWAATALIGAVRDLRRTVAQLQAEAMPAMVELRTVVEQAGADLDRVEDILGTAESIGTTVDSASRLAYLTVSKPTIKTLAFLSGTGRAARRLRRNGESRVRGDAAPGHSRS